MEAYDLLTIALSKTSITQKLYFKIYSLLSTARYASPILKSNFQIRNQKKSIKSQNRGQSKVNPCSEPLRQSKLLNLHLVFWLHFFCFICPFCLSLFEKFLSFGFFFSLPLLFCSWHSSPILGLPLLLQPSFVVYMATKRNMKKKGD